jgi:hypothetical protein
MPGRASPPSTFTPKRGRHSNVTGVSRRAARRRLRCVGVLAVVLSCGLAGCGGSPAAPRRSSSTSIAQSLLDGELAAYYPRSQTPPPPGLFQRGLLDKPKLTFADYQSAMQAAANCIERKVPGASAKLVPQPGWTQIYEFRVASGGRASANEANSSAPTSNSDGGNSSTAAGTQSAGASAPPSQQAAARVPPGVLAGRASIGYCIATYSATVEARWRAMQVLSGPQLSSQRTLFLQCVRAAGVIVAANTSNAKLGQMFSDPSMLAKLTPEQQQASDVCVTRFQEFLFSIAPP